ncbi:hypothetical protein TCAL_07184, partial [Tigriopus californicus]
SLFKTWQTCSSVYVSSPKKWKLKFGSNRVSESEMAGTMNIRLPRIVLQRVDEMWINVPRPSKKKSSKPPTTTIGLVLDEFKGFMELEHHLTRSTKRLYARTLKSFFFFCYESSPKYNAEGLFLNPSLEKLNHLPLNVNQWIDSVNELTALNGLKALDKYLWMIFLKVEHHTEDPAQKPIQQTISRLISSMSCRIEDLSPALRNDKCSEGTPGIVNPLSSRPIGCLRLIVRFLQCSFIEDLKRKLVRGMRSALQDLDPIEIRNIVCGILFLNAGGQSAQMLTQMSMYDWENLELLNSPETGRQWMVKVSAHQNCTTGGPGVLVIHSEWLIHLVNEYVTHVWPLIMKRPMNGVDTRRLSNKTALFNGEGSNLPLFPSTTGISEISPRPIMRWIINAMIFEAKIVDPMDPRLKSFKPSTIRLAFVSYGNIAQNLEAASMYSKDKTTRGNSKRSSNDNHADLRQAAKNFHELVEGKK